MISHRFSSLYFGQAIVWLAVDHTSPAVRRESLACAKRLSLAFPKETLLSVRVALYHLLFEEKRSAAVSSVPDMSHHRGARLAALLSNSANLDNEPDSMKGSLIAGLLLVSHHKDLSNLLLRIEVLSLTTYRQVVGQKIYGLSLCNKLGWILTMSLYKISIKWFPSLKHPCKRPRLLV